MMWLPQMKLFYPEFNIILFLAIGCLALDELTFSIEQETICKNIFSFSLRNQTIFIDMDNDNGVRFKDSVLRCIHHHKHSIIVLRDNLEQLFDDKLRLLDENPNIVFTSKFLHANILDSPLLITILKSHWSAVFILATIEDNKYRCEHGKFNGEAFKNIEEFLNDLWYKHRTMHVFLILPYVCPNNYVVYNGTKPTDGNLYNRTIELVQEDQLSGIISRNNNRMLTKNYPLRGNIFNRFPTAIQECKGTDIYIKTNQKYSGGFCGMDGLVMSDIVSHFEFNLYLPTMADSNRYGYQRHDGNITGSLGHIVNREVDVSFNSRFMVMYTTPPQQYVYIYHVKRDALCVVLNQPDEQPLWLYPIHSFSLQQWLFILACLTSIGMLMWIFTKIDSKMHSNSAATLLSYILNSVNAGLFGFFFKRRSDLLPLRVCCLYASIILLAKYQGYINYIFTTRVRYDVLNSLSDLAKSEIVIQTSPSIYFLINNSINDIENRLLSRIIVLENFDSFEYVVHHPNTATLDRTDAIMLTLMKYTDGHGKPKLYVLNNCLRFYYLSYIANVEFPFRDIIRMFMMRITESGLARMYYTWTRRALGVEVTLPTLNSEPRPASKITIQEQVIAFGVLLVGYTASVAAFVIEIWMDRRQTYRFVH